MNRRRGFTLIELMIVIAIIGILAAIAIPNFRKAREQAREKACYANMRVLLGAIEMYNMDHSSMFDTTFDQSVLKNEGYLKTKVACPEQGGSENSYSIEGDIRNNGVIKCAIHGTVEENK